MASPAGSKRLSIQEFASELRKFPGPAFDGTQQILAFLENTNVLPETLAPYLNWDPQRYTRNLIDKTPFFELLAICWEVGHISSVHNHLEQNCWMAVPVGKLMVENFRVISQRVDEGKCQLETVELVEMSPGQPCAVNPAEPVHRVRNPREFNQRAVSLHVYSRPFDTCVVYSPEQGTCGIIKLQYYTEYGRPVKTSP
jgi:cysteine dioxygenase